MPKKFYQSQILNQSNIGHDYDKIQAIPADVKLVGFRKRARQGPGGTEFEETVQYNVPCGLHMDFERWALGYSYVNFTPPGQFSTPTPATISRIIPAQHPLKPWLYAIAVEMTEGHGALAPDQYASGQYPDGSQMIIDLGKNLIPFGQKPDPLQQTSQLVLEMTSYVDASNATDGYAAMTVTYAALPYAIKTDRQINALKPPFHGTAEMYRWVERRYDLNSSRIPLPGNQCVFNDRNAPAGIVNQPIPQSSANVLDPILDIVWIWYAVPDLNFDEWNKHVGRINSVTFDGQANPPPATNWVGVDMRQGHPIGTLLLYAPKVRESQMRSVNGAPLFDVTFHAQKKLGYGSSVNNLADPLIPRTWNHFPAINGGYYTAATPQPANVFPPFKSPYEQSDWTNLFSIPTPPKQYD